MTTKPVRKHYDWTRATMAHCGCGKWSLTVIFDCEPTCAACIDDHYTSVLENHIDAQAARIAEQQAVIDQRNGECDRLINELAALRQQKPVLFQAEVNGIMSSVTESHYKDCVRFGVKARRLYAEPLPAALPKRFIVKLLPATEESNVPGGAYGWNAYREEAIKAIRAAGGEVAE